VTIPELRVQRSNSGAMQSDGEFVLYWMTSARRPSYNFALEHALTLASELKKPLLVLEALRVDYPWACDRFHHFVLTGMADNQAAFAKSKVGYYPYVEPREGAGRGLLEALAQHAAVVVGDEFPCFFLPHMITAAAKRLSVRFEAVDGNGLLPLRATGERTFARAFDFRRFLLRALPPHLREAPKAEPFKRARIPEFRSVPRCIRERWPAAPARLLQASRAALAKLPIDHSVGATELAGGFRAARRQLSTFLRYSLPKYGEARHPDLEVTSALSPYLHFGHISAHEVFERVLDEEELTLDDFGARAQSQAKGVWQMRPGSEAFVDQLVTWRELGYNFSFQRPDDYQRYSSLPEWARKTLARHAKDPREHSYSRAELEAAETSDPLWNAAQRQLVESGRVQTYLRMLWGKLLLAWTREPEAAYELLVELNNKYALDGRNPNSYSGIGWCFGRYDRPWGPERPIYGMVRFMTTASARRKLKLERYLERWGAER
jgi:deoxyribodipyrimidine photo-lyase